MITSIAPELIPIFLLTTVIEFMVIAAFANIEPSRVVLAVIAANIASSALAYVARNYIGIHPDYILLGMVLVEGAIIYLVAKIPLMRSMGFSLAANIAALLTETGIYMVYP